MTLILHVSEFCGADTCCSTAIARPGRQAALAVLSSLAFDLPSPFLERFFRGEANNEVLDAGVTFPEYLARV